MSISKVNFELAMVDVLQEDFNLSQEEACRVWSKVIDKAIDREIRQENFQILYKEMRY